MYSDHPMKAVNSSPAKRCRALPASAAAAATGAALASGAVWFFARVDRHDERACATTDGLCWTWWDWASVPLTLTVALISLMAVYERLDITPRLAVVPPTVLLAPLPLTAAAAVADWWGAALAGAAWAGALALATWDRHRIPALAAAAALLIASLGTLYR
ncbi:hypothetical protein ACFVJ8_04675 [Streptomyces yangpuensis]|uniref:hypothetical protein n=1 Tax=Streptomyces yangpuensis TaxID=1648182 RepID=UPI00363B2988